VPVTDALHSVQAALATPGAASSDFDLNPNTVLPEGRMLKPAAVLIPIIEGAHGLEVVLTKRSSTLKHHPGQVAFPGGKVDEGDADATAAALREAEEEIALPRCLVRPMGQMNAHETVTGFTVTPIVAHVTGDFDAKPEAGEVAEVFTTPLSHVLDPENFIIEGRVWRGQMRRYYAIPFGPYYIWGATARMLRALSDQVNT